MNRRGFLKMLTSTLPVAWVATMLNGSRKVVATREEAEWPTMYKGFAVHYEYPGVGSDPLRQRSVLAVKRPVFSDTGEIDHYEGAWTEITKQIDPPHVDDVTRQYLDWLVVKARPLPEGLTPAAVHFTKVTHNGATVIRPTTVTDDYSRRRYAHQR